MQQENVFGLETGYDLDGFKLSRVTTKMRWKTWIFQRSLHSARKAA
jgi:hypothetical protein